MAEERTLALVKPDAAEHTRGFIENAKEYGFYIVGQKVVWFTPSDAGIFYLEHKTKSFYTTLCLHMASGPVTAMVLEHPLGETIKRWRMRIADTDPNNAADGTLRHRFGGGRKELHRNVVHGSANPKDAEREIALLFTGLELA